MSAVHDAVKNLEEAADWVAQTQYDELVEQANYPNDHAVQWAAENALKIAMNRPSSTSRPNNFAEEMKSEGAAKFLRDLHWGSAALPDEVRGQSLTVTVTPYNETADAKLRASARKKEA